MMMRRTFALLVLVACADRAESTDPMRACADATDVLAMCGLATDASPFGTCQAEQHELAEDLLAIFADQGCAGISNAKADGFACTALPILCVEHSVAELAPFSTDGCSMFPDGTLGDPMRWQHCCVTHDFAYYAGGPETLREAADRQLRTCIEAETNAVVADLVYYGVRLGGTPALPTPWRWGYGWAYDPLHGYRTVSPAQSVAASMQVQAYQLDPVPPHAFEQRLLELAAAIASVPGMQLAIDQFQNAIRYLD